jgi:hypothetical protein
VAGQPLADGRGAGDSQDVAGGVVHRGDGAVECGGDEAGRKAANGILVQRCEIAHQLLVSGEPLACLASLSRQTDTEGANRDQSSQENHVAKDEIFSREIPGKDRLAGDGGRIFK